MNLFIYELGIYYKQTEDVCPHSSSSSSSSSTAAVAESLHKSNLQQQLKFEQKLQM